MEHVRLKRSRLTSAALALALVASACGSDDDTAASDTETADTTDSSMEDGTEADMGDTEGMAMNMGDASATRADDVSGAALASGDVALLDTRPQGFDATTGTAWIARHTGGTTVTVELEGLVPETDFISHVHADACANNGGDHFQFEVGGPTVPPNEIHLAFTSDSDGNGFMTAENSQIAGLEAVAFVVHPSDLIDNKIACVDFVEAEEGAAAAAIAAGVDSTMEDDGMEETDE